MGLCSFSSYKIHAGHGRRLVRVDGKTFYFLGSKVESLFLQRKNPRKIAWTVLYRRKHRKGLSEETTKRRTRRTQKFSALSRASRRRSCVSCASRSPRSALPLASRLLVPLRRRSRLRRRLPPRSPRLTLRPWLLSRPSRTCPRSSTAVLADKPIVVGRSRLWLS